MNALTADPVLGHITTFGGHPVCCAAGNAAFDVLLEEDLITGINRKEELFRNTLIHPMIKSFRSAGLLMALEFESWEINKAIIDQCISLGVFTDWFLFASNCMRLAPPLSISDSEIKQAVEIILKACDSVGNRE
jgi:acetylornithine/succinyldiaminopimelate/putrescine aminotransferase